jgi:hypothetical protein
MSKKRLHQDGMALIFAMLAIVIIFGSLSLLTARLLAEKRTTDHAYDTLVLEEAARAGIEVAIQQMWNRYITTNGNTTGNWASYKYFVTNVLSIPNTEDLNGNGRQDEGETNTNGIDGWESWPSSYETHGYPMIDEPFDITDPDSGRVIATIEGVHVTRNDSLLGTSLTLRATANVNGKRRAAVQRLNIGGQLFEGAQFAVLANNISCLLCHAEIRSLPLERNSDPSLYNTFDRVKVASLESLLVRANQAYSNFAGTLYTRGKVYKENGSLYSASQLASDSQFKSYAFDTENGKLTQSGTGAMSKKPWDVFACEPMTPVEPFKGIYLDYPGEAQYQTDGPVPVSFPAPYPDLNEDRHVDDDEFDMVVNAADGSISFSLDPDDAVGSIQAGVAYGVPHGSAYTGTELPTASNAALTQLTTSGAYEGNLILVGSPDDPIVIESKVAVNGDLVLKGPVKGRGQLLVRGNVYVMGDVTYADGPGAFGSDGDGNENLFSMVAGGSVMMGDYLTVRGTNPSWQDTAQYPDSSLSIHFRKANNSVKKTSGTKTEYIKTGYFDQWSVDPNMKVPGRQGQQFSFTMSELQLFNQMEIQKAINDASYTPRLYGMRESQPDLLYTFDSGEEHAVHYNRSGVALVSDYLLSKGIGLDLLDDAAIHYLNPAGNWISEDTLRQVWYQDELSRPSSGRPWKFDGLIYSNNAVFTMVRSKGRHESYTYGKMELRGGVIAADLGVFAPEGFRMDYDPRVERFLNVQDASMVEFRRGPFYYAAADYSEG